MGFRGWPTRRSPISGTVAVPAADPVGEADEPPTPEQIAELQDAWVELMQAAEGSGVTSLQACSRNGKRWEEDAAAVRGLASTLRKIRAEGLLDR